MSVSPDARNDYRPTRDYAVQLIALAAQAAGSRNKLVVRAGISRRRLGYIEAGHRQTESGLIPVRMSFAEQVILEAIANEAIP